MRRVGTKIFIFSISRTSQLSLAWNEAVMVFFNFLNFFPIFLQFSITRRVGTKRNDNFYFPTFSAFCNLFWLEMKPQPHVLIFLIFRLFYWNFLLRVGLERNWTITFIFLLSHTFPTYFGLKWILHDIFYFLQFLILFFWNFLQRVQLERNVMIIFVFTLSKPFPTYFGLKVGHNGIS